MEDLILSTIRERYHRIYPFLDEPSRILWLANEAWFLGRGGISAVHQATGVHRNTIRLALQKLTHPSEWFPGRCRRSGGSRKKMTEHHQQLLSTLNTLIDPVTRVAPESSLHWTCQSLRKLTNELRAQGDPVGRITIQKLLKQQGYSLQANNKTSEGTNHPDRNKQFEYINKQVKKHIIRNQPVISVDTKKKENIGNDSNKGREYQPKKHPVETKMHDVPNVKLGKAIPYGVYDIIHMCSDGNRIANRLATQIAVQTLGHCRLSPTNRG
ncbi:MAG: ISAzo13 family transposase [Planctomycetaceae bacterium]|jgi:hypothetical protein|nr:ISAzo13 family transposase [Planctomycetaceae bacterium]